MIMFGGLLAFLGIYAGSAAKVAYDNYDMKKTTRTVDEKGNVHYMDRFCNDYINGERVKRVETTDRNGVKLYSTVGVNSSKVYSTSYGSNIQQRLDYSEQNKQRAIERGELAYEQYNPYFGRPVTTEIATGRTITCLFAWEYGDKPIYKKWYFRPECQGKYDYDRTVKGDYGIDITEEEYNKLTMVVCRSYRTLPSDGQVLNKLWGTNCFT